MEISEIGGIWEHLPINVKGEILRRYREAASVLPKEQYELGVLHTYESLFGVENLNPDIFPEIKPE